jgi:DNA-binding CsgD family transcriptional regulator
LAYLQPAIAALLRAHDAAAEGIGSGEATDREHERLEGTLQRFGSSVLTPREGQVMRLMLEGYSAPSLAKVLGLSVETVRVHRRNIYEKLRISSLGELFNLALRAVTTSSHGQALDPLVELKPDLAS